MTIQNAATWTWNYINTSVFGVPSDLTSFRDTPAVVNTAPNKPALMQGEVGASAAASQSADQAGWPTNAIPGGSLSLNGSAASMANSQTFLDTWYALASRCSADLCAGSARATPTERACSICAASLTSVSQYIYFEAFDGTSTARATILRRMQRRGR